MTIRKFAAPGAVLLVMTAMAGCPSPTDPTTKPSKSPAATASKAPSPSPTATASALGASTPPASKAPVSAAPSTAVSTPPASATPSTAVSTAPVAAYVQVDRLGRPAINEGLIVTNSLLGLWNSVGPKDDLSTPAQPIASEARSVLKALGNTDGQVTTLFNQLLPDVMRIDTLRTSGYATSVGGTGLDNLDTATKIPVGGRMPTDDVMDITLFLIVPDTTNTAVPGLRSDNVGYDTEDLTGNKHQPLLTDFPYLAAPN